MLVEVKVPQLSESVSEATLLTWHKQPGEYVERDENLIDIETDKVVLELPAPQAGVLAKVIKGDGGTVVSDEVIATIDTDGKPSGAAKAATSAAAAKQAPKAAPAPAAAPAAVAKAKTAAEPVALPAARKLASENKVELTAIAGTGRGGRITKEDVANKIGQNASASAAATAPAAARFPAPAPIPVQLPEALGDRPEQRVPMSRLRQRVAERLIQSQSTAAILTTFNEVNMQPVMDLRKKYQERFEKEHGTRLGFTSFFVKASVHALKKFPVVNASVDGTDIIYHGYYDIGIAVASPRGLVVPILRNADQLSLSEIEKQIADFAKRAQEGKLAIEELTGGTFSITNGGVFGSLLSSPIINPPQSAVLGMHRIEERPVVRDGQIVARPMMYLALSYDHRLIDGREAVTFLVRVKEAIEDPTRLLIDL